MVRKAATTYLAERKLSLECIVEQPSVNNRDQCMTFDVGRKVEVSMWFLDVPLFLEFGRGFTVICRLRQKERRS